MGTKLAIIHTTPVTIEPLKALAAELMPDCRVVNIMDDSILPELQTNGGRSEAILERWRQYALIAEKQGAQVILSACSSVGEVSDRVRTEVSVPVVRIDRAMAELAVRSAGVIGVAATLPTTLGPTERLLRATAAAAGREIRLVSVLAAAAYGKLMAGDAAGHDRELAAALRKLAGETELVVLAQASMARALEGFTEEEKNKFASSPRLGMQAAAELLRGIKERN